uniref:axonemal dynein light chain domain-containing protein 1 n=1 Tax=Centroberyx gerrardi TaxID=166262 RepID=UPI003AAA2159
MFASMKARPAAGLPGTERAEADTAELPDLQQRVPADSRKTQPLPVHSQFIPEELLVSLSSTVCPGNAPAPAPAPAPAHRHSKGCGIRRPDAVWHHPLGRNKYKYFLEQPTSLTGAGRDISFLCDAMATQRKKTCLPPLAERSGHAHTQDLNLSESLIPEEYHIVKNKGLQGLDFYEDKFTVQLQDEEQRLRVFPSLRPSGRLEAVQLMKMMDDMLEKAGVEQQSEELTELSQMEGLLELVRAEQNIYNIVFHELIRQVSVGCAERGQLLARLRQRYQSLLERIPRRLKALHTEALAQRALDRRLTEEILRFKSSVQQLHTELSRIRDHDASVSQHAERAQQQLAEALYQAHSNSDLVQSYHELYEMQRRRLEAQLLRLSDERDGWSRATFSLALKVISVKKLQLVSRLHVSEQSWSNTAQHCSCSLTAKDAEDLSVVLQLTDRWKDQLTAFMSQLGETERAQCERIHGIQRGIAKWLAFCSAQNRSPDPKYEKVSEEEIHADLKQWSDTLTLQCERYGGEELLCRQQALGELGRLQGRWADLGLRLFGRHPGPDAAPPAGQEAMRRLGGAVSELHRQLDTRVNGESGIHKQLMSLAGPMESWAAKLRAAAGRPDAMPVSDWLKLEKALCGWQSLAEEASQNVASTQAENDKTQNKPHVNIEMDDVFDTMRKFVSSQSNFFDCENQRLCEEAGSIHTAQTRWMLDLLLLMVPDHSEDRDRDRDHLCLADVSLEKLEEDAKTLAQKLDYFSRYISSSCRLVLEERIQKNPGRAGAEDQMYECNKLQRECSDWLETCGILLSGLKGGPVELSVTRPGPASGSDAALSPADSMESLVNVEVSSEPVIEEQVRDESEAEPAENMDGRHEQQEQQEICQVSGAGVGLQAAPSDRRSPVLKLIGYDGNVTERMLGGSGVRLDGTEQLVVSPATDGAQKALDSLSTVCLLQRELQVSEVRLQTAEQRALEAEEALQAALEKIQDLERQLQGRPSLEPRVSKKTPEPSPAAVTHTAPPKKTSAEAKPTSSTKKTRRR